MAIPDVESAQKVRWFVTVIHHAALRSKRKFRRWGRESLVLNQLSVDSSTELIETLKCPTAEAEFRNTEFKQLFTQLPDLQRCVMLDLYVRDFTQQQTASRAGITQQQVSRLRDRAISTLKQEVGIR